jgi:CheY-like chemotaxis protein
MNSTEPFPRTAESRAVILIAEDNPDSREALRALLEAYGFDVLAAENGVEAVERAIAQKPDLILMDIMMPVMDGLQATRTLRASPDFRQVPIVALTAMAGSREKALAAGCDDHLAKPVNLPVFLETIRGWLKRASPSSA